MSARSGRRVDRLIQRYAPDTSIKELERQNNLAPGALSNHLKPASRGRFPRQPILERFAAVLRAPLREVTAAFAADAGLALVADPLPAHAQQVLDDYLALDTKDQALARAILHTIRHRPEPDQHST
ncbi:hypothetical protein [Actinophytocola sp.]|uniref:hypothetical protein n=1 Tax=Actinophytocola sp. TaxID=1872138 RepID=UPI0025BD7FA7|nr:hypothetical protein [Actinophytocola sp.]